jgi:hypothetical protein
VRHAGPQKSGCLTRCCLRQRTPLFPKPAAPPPHPPPKWILLGCPPASTLRLPRTPADGLCKPDIRLTGHKVEGYGLSWNQQKAGYLLSGSDDAQICIWDVSGATQQNRVCGGRGRAAAGRGGAGRGLAVLRVEHAPAVGGGDTAAQTFFCC